MTFEAYETSARSGKPRHLFVFKRQGLTWRFTSGSNDATVGGNTYLAAAIARSEIKQTVEKPQDQITITFPFERNPAATELPVTQAFGANWHPYVPADTVSVVCMAWHADDPDAQAAIEWQGVVAQPKFNDGQLELTCIPYSQIDRAQYQGPKWSRGDWKAPYSTGVRGFNLNPADYTIAGTLTAVDGLQLMADEFNGTPFSLAGGVMWWTRSDGIVERRSIMAHSGSTITLLSGAGDIAVGLAVQALPGYERNWAAAAARNNTIWYGGSVYMPVENPYEGGSMSWG